MRHSVDAARRRHRPMVETGLGTAEIRGRLRGDVCERFGGVLQAKLSRLRVQSSCSAVTAAEVDRMSRRFWVCLAKRLAQTHDGCTVANSGLLHCGDLSPVLPVRTTVLGWL